MQRLWTFCIALLTLSLVSQLSPVKAEEKGGENRFFELRIYHANPGKLDSLLKRFRDHTVALFEKHGMTNVGYWLPVDKEDQRLVYLMAYPSREARDTSWEAFRADPNWKAAYAASTADGKLIKQVDKVFLGPTGYSPSLKIEAKDPNRLFELRRYTTNEGKLDDLDARFRDHTIELFENHGMTNLAYFHLSEGEKGAENTLVYFLAHQDQEARDASFDAFRLDPAWQEARKASEADGPLLFKGGVQSTLLRPVDFSPMK